ncbi:MAG: hypothetical protein ACKVQK_05295 [Burkholderiales bacterium]
MKGLFYVVPGFGFGGKWFAAPAVRNVRRWRRLARKQQPYVAVYPIEYEIGLVDRGRRGLSPLLATRLSLERPGSRNHFYEKEKNNVDD